MPSASETTVPPNGKSARKRKSTPAAITATDTSVPPTHTIPYDDAVSEGKEIVAKIEDAERGQLQLGELADKLEPKYGDRTLAKYAKAIGIEQSTLNHYRTVYRAWKDNILPPGAKFAVLKELATVPDRAELIKSEPNMSKRRAEVHRVLKYHPQRAEILSEHPDLTCASQARNFMHSYDTGAENGKSLLDWDKNAKRWFNKLVDRANEDIDEAAIVDQPMTVEQQCDLLMGIDPYLLETVKEAGEARLKLYDFLSRLCEKPQPAVAEEFKRRAKAKADLAERERRAKKAPTPQATSAVQMGA